MPGALSFYRLLENWKIFSHIFPVEIHVFVLETTENYSNLIISVVLQPLSNCPNSNRGSLCNRVSIDACRNARKCNRMQTLLFCQVQAINVAILE